MKTIDLVQGSAEWHAHRAKAHNASDAPIIMGVSPYVTRTALVKQKAVGTEREIDAATQKVFDKGHEVEPLLRAMAETIIGQDLFPIVGVSDDGFFSASFDGVVMDETVIFEAKQYNAEKMVEVHEGRIPKVDYWQVVHQFAANESAEKCLYMVGDGTESGTNHIWINRSDIAADIPKLRAAWVQFDADVAAYQPEAAKVEAVGRAPGDLPALFVQLAGGVQATNLPEFKSAAIEVFRSIRTDLNTDADFADAEKAVGWCKKVEDKLKAAKENAQGQMASVDELFRAIDEISAEARAKRLELDKLVTNRKEALRVEIVNKAKADVIAHVTTLNESLQGLLSAPASLVGDLTLAMKGKKTLSSLNDAAAQVVANNKIIASQQAEQVRASLKILADAGRSELFPDRQTLAFKNGDDLRNLIAARIADADAREKQRAEDARKADADKLAAQNAAPFAPAPPPSAVVQPMPVKGKKKPTRPTDDEIIAALALHFRQHEMTVIGWLLEVNLNDASTRYSKEFA
jgi:putative phage-type endonuclease